LLISSGGGVIEAVRICEEVEEVIMFAILEIGICLQFCFYKNIKELDDLSSSLSLTYYKIYIYKRASFF